MSRLIIQSSAQTIALTVQGLAGIKNPTLRLTSPDLKWNLQVPAEAFNGVDAGEPGKMLLVSLTLTRVEVSVEDDEPMKSPKLITPGRAN